MTHLPLLHLRCAITTTLTDTDTARDAALLDAQETKTYHRFLASEDRRDYAAAHALLRRTLTSVVPNHPPEAWCFERTALGKPYLSAPAVDGPPLHFSLSHTRGHVAGAISRDGEVGVDVECRSHINDLERLMAGVCSTDERAQIRAVPQPEQVARFLDLWSLKEAYVKACGTGIRHETCARHLRSSCSLTHSCFTAIRGGKQMLVRAVPAGGRQSHCHSTCSRPGSRGAPRCCTCRHRRSGATNVAHSSIWWF